MATECWEQKLKKKVSVIKLHWQFSPGTFYSLNKLSLPKNKKQVVLKKIIHVIKVFLFRRFSYLVSRKSETESPLLTSVRGKAMAKYKYNSSWRSIKMTSLPCLISTWSDQIVYLKCFWCLRLIISCIILAPLVRYLKLVLTPYQYWQTRLTLLAGNFPRSGSRALKTYYTNRIKK